MIAEIHSSSILGPEENYLFGLPNSNCAAWDHSQNPISAGDGIHGDDFDEDFDDDFDEDFDDDFEDDLEEDLDDDQDDGLDDDDEFDDGFDDDGA